jgi:dTDP-4-amino-4,6-dideoxygalactose transaminase
LLLVDDQGRLRRTVTDGDLRRLMLAGRELSDRLEALPEQSPVTLRAPATPARALTAMNDAKVDQLPILDDAGRPIDLLRRRDVDSQILLSTPHLGEHEMGFVEEAFRSNWIAPLGPNVNAFERELAEHVGVGHAAALSSGTAALHLALRVLGVGRGDKVFCSSLTFAASANPILYEGAEPVFIDSEPQTWNMSPSALKRALEDAQHGGRTPRAVIVVNLYGQSADYDPIVEICAHHGVPIVEDAAESLGATYKGRPSGSIGRIGIYSFNGNKIITTSGGGMLVSDDAELVERVRFLSTQAREPADWYEHKVLGYNYRMSNILAGIGRGQLRVLEDRVTARREVFRRYAEGLADVAAIDWMPEAPFGRSNRWLTACALAAPHDPQALIAALAEHRIEARRVWKPMHLQPLYAGAAYWPHEPGADISADLFARGVCLPSGSNMSAEQQARAIDVIRAALRPA